MSPVWLQGSKLKLIIVTVPHFSTESVILSETIFHHLGVEEAGREEYDPSEGFANTEQLWFLFSRLSKETHSLLLNM